MKTRIAVTIGNSSRSRSVIREMALLGASIFRINFSHGSPEEWVDAARLVRSVEAELGKYFILLGDLRGPSVRIGDLKAPVEVKANETVKIIQAAESEGGSSRLVPLASDAAFNAIKKGHIILMDDGRIAFRVESASGSEILMRALT
ncbi:MAG: pyruvate kinase, partial [Candidatus Brockarchaeota archaeon]|nr:pyruvate kinase [Candidatus Brockarchaeota archaeon]